MTDAFDLDAYLVRIGYSGVRAPTLATLRGLHALHPTAIAFENLDPLLGRPVPLDLASLQAKLVRARRGGYCFEQNTLMQAALEAMGFQVSCLIARVLWNRPAGAHTARSHMLLRVDLPEGSFLADVGFGGKVQTAPLRLEIGAVQHTPGARHRLMEAGRALDLEVDILGGWRKTYRLDLDPQGPVDFEVANWHTSSHPSSIFVGNLMMARIGAGERYALMNRDFTVRRDDGSVENRRLENPDALAEVLETAFKVTPPESAEAIFRRLPN